MKENRRSTLGSAVGIQPGGKVGSRSSRASGVLTRTPTRTPYERKLRPVAHRWRLSFSRQGVRKGEFARSSGISVGNSGEPLVTIIAIVDSCSSKLIRATVVFLRLPQVLHEEH